MKCPKCHCENPPDSLFCAKCGTQLLKDKSALEVAGVFVAVGLKPNTDYLKGVLKLDAGGYIIIDEKMETNVPGIFAAGDVRHNSARQAITAAGDGATAAFYIGKALSEYE